MDRRWFVFNMAWLAVIAAKLGHPNHVLVSLERAFLAVAVGRGVWMLGSWAVGKVMAARRKEDAKIEKLVDDLKVDRSSSPTHDLVTCRKCHQTWVTSKTVRDEQIKAAMQIYLHECKGDA
jgi:hypothetical protein